MGGGGGEENQAPKICGLNEWKKKFGRLIFLRGRKIKIII